MLLKEKKGNKLKRLLRQEQRITKNARHCLVSVNILTKIIIHANLICALILDKNSLKMKSTL